MVHSSDPDPLVEPKEGYTGVFAMLAHNSVLQRKYAFFLAGIEQQERVPKRVLALCRMRIAYMHACPGEQQHMQNQLSEADCSALRMADFTGFSQAEQAALTLTEYLPHNVHGLGDELVQQVDEHFGHGGCVALLTAISFFDVNCRLSLVLGVPLNQSAAPLSAQEA